MSSSTYAVVGTWIVQEGRWDEQVQELHQNLVPRAHQVPGFVAAYWLGNRAKGRTNSTIILENEEAAKGFQAFVLENPLSREEHGVTMETLDVYEVAAETHR